MTLGKIMATLHRHGYDRETVIFVLRDWQHVTADGATELVDYWQQATGNRFSEGGKTE